MKLFPVMIAGIPSIITSIQCFYEFFYDSSSNTWVLGSKNGSELVLFATF